MIDTTQESLETLGEELLRQDEEILFSIEKRLALLRKAHSTAAVHHCQSILDSLEEKIRTKGEQTWYQRWFG